MRHYPLLLLVWIVLEAHGLDGKDVSRRTKRISNYRGGRGRSPYDSGSGFPTYGTERWDNIGGGGVPVAESGEADNDNLFSSNNDWDRYSIGSGIWDNTGEDILSGTRRSGNESDRRNNWEDNFAVFGNRRWNNIFGGGAGPVQGGSVANETRQSGNGLRRGSNNWDDYFSVFGGTGRQNPDGEGTRNNVGGATRNNAGGGIRNNADDGTRNNAGGTTRNNAGDATRNTAGETRNTVGETRNTAGDETRDTVTEERENSGTEESENVEDDESENAEDDESENAETGFGSREQPTIAQGRGYAEGEDISIGSAQSGDVGGSGIGVRNGVASGYGEAKIG